jgi:hypothetical protein
MASSGGSRVVGSGLSILWPAISWGSNSLALMDFKVAEAVAAPGQTSVEVALRDAVAEDL